MKPRKRSEDESTRLMDTPTLAAYMSCGYNTARAFSKQNGAIVRIGTRLLHDRVVIDKAIENMRCS